MPSWTVSRRMLANKRLQTNQCVSDQVISRVCKLLGCFDGFWMEVADIIVSIREIQVFSSWPESSYHPIHNNCTTFAQELLGDR